MKKLSLLLGLLLLASTSWAGPLVTGPVYNAANVDINGGTVDGTVIGETTPAKGVFSPSIAKGPAASTSFAGTISRSGTTLTFSSAADAILAGYSATSPVVGTTVIHPTGPVTMYITAWLSNVTATVDSSGTLAAQTATSVQLPIASFVNSAGVVQGWMNAAGNVYFAKSFIGNVGMGMGAVAASYRLVVADTATYNAGPLIIQNLTATDDSVGSIIGYRTGPGAGNEIGTLIFQGQTDANNSLFRLSTLTGGRLTEKLRVDKGGNILTGGITSAGTSAAKNLVIGEGTAPTTSPANASALWSADLNGAAGTNRLHERTESGVSSPIALQTEVDASINPKAMSQAVAMTAAASGSSGITIADNDNINFGTGNFTLVWRGSLPDWTPSASQYLLRKLNTGTKRLYLYVSTDGYPAVYLYDYPAVSLTANTIQDGSNNEVVVVISRTSVSGTATFYLNGAQYGAPVNLLGNALVDLGTDGILYLLGNDAQRFAGTTSFAATYNRALTASEVKDLYLNGVAESDKWGSQTAVYTSDFSAGEDSWAVTNGTAAGNIDSIGGQDNNLRLTLSGGSAQHRVFKSPNGLAGYKKGRKTLSIYIPSANSTLNGFAIYRGGGYLTGYGLTGAGSVCARDTWISVNVTDLEESATPSISIYGLNGTSDTVNADGEVMYIRGVALFQAGATLALQSENIGIDKWYDASSNGLNATYPTAGATLTRPVTKSIKQGTITAGGTGAVTVTIDMILGGVITADPSAARAYTFETGATSDAIGRISINDAFEWTVINTNATYAVTVTASSGHTIVGNAVVALSSSGRFKTVKTASGVFVTYRLN